VNVVVASPAYTKEKVYVVDEVAVSALPMVDLV
jgi:hypothetical protein